MQTVHTCSPVAVYRVERQSAILNTTAMPVMSRRRALLAPATMPIGGGGDGGGGGGLRRGGGGEGGGGGGDCDYIGHTQNAWHLLAANLAPARDTCA